MIRFNEFLEYLKTEYKGKFEIYDTMHGHAKYIQELYEEWVKEIEND